MENHSSLNQSLVSGVDLEDVLLVSVAYTKAEVLEKRSSELAVLLLNQLEGRVIYITYLLSRHQRLNKVLVRLHHEVVSFFLLVSGVDNHSSARHCHHVEVLCANVEVNCVSECVEWQVVAFQVELVELELTA